MYLKKKGRGYLIETSNENIFRQKMNVPILAFTIPDDRRISKKKDNKNLGG